MCNKIHSQFLHTYLQNDIGVFSTLLEQYLFTCKLGCHVTFCLNPSRQNVFTSYTLQSFSCHHLQLPLAYNSSFTEYIHVFSVTGLRLLMVTLQEKIHLWRGCIFGSTGLSKNFSHQRSLHFPANGNSPALDCRSL